jgi:IS5 family transposase
MNRQTTFTDLEYAGRKRNSRREMFLEVMDALIPWQELIGINQTALFNGKRRMSAERDRNHAAYVPAADMV